jgi:decaprenyl-phosphate phosphoribosyltransferase
LLVFIFIDNKYFFLIIGAYLLLNIFYSFFLKHIAIIDIVCIAIGFVLRVFAGGIAGDVPVSHWIIIMSFLLAVFLALAKRRDDLILASQGHNVRKSVDGYSLDFISSSMAIMASVVIVAYLLYTVSPETIARHGTDKLYLTSFWVIVGLLRYLQLTFVEGKTGSPTKLLLKDYFLQLTITLWIIIVFILIYVA